MAAPGWFRYRLRRKLTEEEAKQVKALAGPIYSPWGQTVSAHENVAWFTERQLNQMGVPFFLEHLPPNREPPCAIASLAELREWVPNFLTHYQNDFIVKMGHLDGILAVMPTGAGKTLSGIVYGLLREGPIVFVTRAAARRTICGEIRRYTTCEPVLLEGKAGRIIDPRTRFVVVGWESLQAHYQSILNIHPTTIIFDESHVASNHKRREAIVQRDEEAMQAAREEGKVKVKYRRLNNRFAAAEDLSRAAQYRLALTATPIRDRVRNLWGQVDLIIPKGMGSFYPWAHRYCNPAEAPIWMGDFTFKPIAEVRVGDEVVGWDHKAPGPSRRNGPVRKMHKSHLTRATVTRVQQHTAAVVRVTFASGRVIRCTADHRWLSGRTGTNNPSAFVTPAVGRELAFVTDPTPAVLTPEQQHLAGWLAGMYDGEGSNSFICQSSQHNPDTWAKLDTALTTLGIPHTMLLDADRKSGCGGALIIGGRDGLLRFHKLTRPVRFARSAEKSILTGKFRTPDEIVKIEADGVEPVFALTTTTGNYVAWGYASKNCGAHENPWGGIDTTGRGGDEAMQELVARLSFFTFYIPQSVTHRDLPPLRRQVTYIPPDELSTGRDVLKELREHGYNSAVGEVWAKLAHAAAMKRDRVVDEAVSGAFRAPDGKSGGKVVVFTGLRADCEKIAAGIRKANKDLTVFVGHGGTNPRERDRIREDYMAHPGPCVLVGTGDSWGESLNLQDTDLAIIAMLPWTPGQIRQWEGRFKRHGMKRPVLVLYLVAEGTADEHVAHALLQKLPAVEMVAKDEVLTEFATDLRGDEDAIAAGFLAKLTSSEEEDDDEDRDPDAEEEDPNRLPKD